MAVDDLPPSPINKKIKYHLMSFNDKEVQARIPIWKTDPVAFCVEALNFKPHWYQESILRDKSFFIAAAWGRQLGKSEIIAVKALYVALTQPEAEVVIIAPTRRQSKRLYKKILLMVNKSPLIRQTVLGKPTSENMIFTNYSLIANLPAGVDGDTVRGYSIALLIVDEAAFVPDNVFTAVEQGLASTGGNKIYISTPRGKHNKFYRAFFPNNKKGFDMSKSGHQQVGTFSCYRYDYTVGLSVFKPNGQPQLSEFHVKELMEEMGGENSWQSRAEYKAEFIEDIDSYWTQELINKFFNHNFQILDGPEEGHYYYQALDIAKTRDKTAMITAELLYNHPLTGKPLVNPHIRIVEILYWVTGGIENQYPYILANVQKWQPRALYFDKTALGERPFEELQQTYDLVDIIEGIQFQSKTKIMMYGTLTFLMASAPEIEGWNCRIQSYYQQEAKTTFENLIYELPEVTTAVGGKRESSTAYIYAGHGNDDIPDAIAMITNCLGGKNDTGMAAVVPKSVMTQTRIMGLEKDENVVLALNLDRGHRGRGNRSSKVFW